MKRQIATAAVGRSSLRTAITTAIISLCSITADAADVASEKAGELYSIETRDLLGNHELSVSFGTLPLDAFDKGITLQGSYTYHFTHLIGWEIIGGTYSFNIDTGLESELDDRFEVSPEKEPRLLALLESNFVFKPLYGKLALINSSVATGEVYLVAGPVLGFLEGGSVPVGLDAGVGLRMFIGRYFSARLDIRDYILLPGFNSVENHLYLGLGLAITFGFGDESDDED